MFFYIIFSNQPKQFNKFNNEAIEQLLLRMES